jgi:hypothetical protein
MVKKVIEGYPCLGGNGAVLLFDNPLEERDIGNNIFRWQGIEKIMEPFTGKKVRITIEEVTE